MQITLKHSGLPLTWDGGQEEMQFDKLLAPVQPALRRLGDMREVLYEKIEGGEKGLDSQRILYYMYRDLALPQDKKMLQQYRIRYDITVLVPGTIGREYIKTAGHYHPVKPGTDQAFPEIYEVLSGRACYLFQRPASPEQKRGPGQVEQVQAVLAEKGDKVLIPPGFGHITINLGPDYLIMSNLVEANFNSVYEPFRRLGGGAYYCLVPENWENKGAGQPNFVSNSSYQNLPPLTWGNPTRIPELVPPLYQAFLQHPEYFSFLT